VIRILLRVLALSIVALLAIPGCSDDSGEGGEESSTEDAQGDGADADTDATGDDEGEGGDVSVEPDIDLCSLLEVSEIDAEFGEQGSVLDGVEELDQCSWDVGQDQSEPGTGSVHVFVQYVDPSLPIESAEERFAQQRAAYSEAVELEDLGDEAYYEPNGPSVNVRSGALIWFVQAPFIPEVPDTQQKLENLAALVEDRL
jgi:hypothetical protein